MLVIFPLTVNEIAGTTLGKIAKWIRMGISTFEKCNMNIYKNEFLHVQNMIWTFEFFHPKKNSCGKGFQ